MGQVGQIMIETLMGILCCHTIVCNQWESEILAARVDEYYRRELFHYNPTSTNNYHNQTA
jgi:hypothetical protein